MSLLEQHVAALAAVGIEAPDPTTGGTDRPATGAYHSAVSARQAFQAAGRIARGTRPRVPLQGAHVVLAVSESEHGTTARALRAIGVDRSALADAARTTLASG